MKPQGLYHNYQNQMFLLIAFGFYFFSFSDPIAFADIFILAQIVQRTHSRMRKSSLLCFNDTPRDERY